MRKNDCVYLNPMAFQDCARQQGRLQMPVHPGPLQRERHAPAAKRRKTENHVYSPSQRRELARYAAENGVIRAARHFSSVLGHSVNDREYSQSGQIGETVHSEDPATYE